MFVAKSSDLDYVFTGAKIELQNSRGIHDTFREGFVCPICGRDVTYNRSTFEQPFEYFTHSDGSKDCFKNEAVSDEHRLAVEVAVKALINRISEVTGKRVEVNVEKWIGAGSNFIITDIRVASPLKIAAEIFYKSERLGLGRRFSTMFGNNYRTYLIFHTDGRHNTDRIEQHIQKIAPLQVGRFDPEVLEVTLGDLFSEQQIELTQKTRESLPNYIVQ